MNTDVTTDNAIKSDIQRVDHNKAIAILQSLTVATPECFSLNNIAENDQNNLTTIFFAARHDEAYAGIIAISVNPLNHLHIDCLAVRHPGLLESVGSRLLLAAENFCLEDGYASLTVKADYPKNNEPAQNSVLYSLFTHAGYKPVYEISSDMNHIKFLMQKYFALNDFTFIDLTHSLSADVPHWGVDTGFKYNARYIQTADTAGHVKFRVQRLEMSAGIGTHLDAPSHCFENAAAIDKIPLLSLITACRMIDVSAKAIDSYSISVEDILLFEAIYGVIPKGACVILYTGWSQRWNQPDKYRNEKIFPNISVEAAKLLLSRNIAGLGIDTLSPDAFGSNFPVHELILGAGKYIIENVANADQLDPVDCYIFALPMKIMDGTEAPMRLIGMKRKKS